MRKSFLALFLCLGACGELNQNPVNQEPLILGVTVPAFISANDTLLVETFDSERDTLAVSLSVKTASGTTLNNVLTRPFSDSGLYGDKTAFDGIFTGVLNSTLLLGQSSSVFDFVFSVKEKSGRSSQFTVSVLQNPDFGHPPVISNLTAPDTVNTSQVSIFTLTVNVSDPDGLSDIASVTRVNVTSGIQAYPLNDAGFNGDVTAGDGIFTEQVSVSGPPPPSPGSYLFRVQATDKLGLKSNTLEKTIVIIN